jgi:hypothetical protein
VEIDEVGQESALRLLAESVLRVRSNELDDLWQTAVTNLLALPVEELTVFLEQLPQLSADELRQRLGETSA